MPYNIVQSHILHTEEGEVQKLLIFALKLLSFLEKEMLCTIDEFIWNYSIIGLKNN